MSTPVSIVIPSLNSGGEIKRALSSLKPQLKEGDEIIVIDGGSIDRTLELAENYGCKIILYPGSTIGGARNAGVEASSNEIVIQTDTDIEAVPWLIEGIRKHYSDGEVVGVAVGWKDGKRRFLGDAICALLEGNMKYADCLQSYRKSAYFKTDGHPNVSFGEQIGLWTQIKKTGKTVYDPNLYVYHYSERNVNLPSYIIGGSVLAGGLAYEHASGQDVGYAIIGHGAGWILGQAGIDLLKDVPGMQEYWDKPNHLHHWIIGLLLMVGALTFYNSIPKEWSVGIAGVGSGLVVHDLMIHEG